MGHLQERKASAAVAVAILLLLGATPAMAQTPAELKVGIDTMWVLITAALVFFMNLGFALVESAMCRSKNTVNILSKNFIVFAISSLAFYVFGWG
jgi:Amt family ammonium transporter